MPGYETCFYPESIVDLGPWVGTKYDSLTAISKETGKEIPEVNAGMALKIMGLFLDHEIRQMPDGKWVLHRAYKKERYFTGSAFYRLTRGKVVD